VKKNAATAPASMTPRAVPSVASGTWNVFWMSASSRLRIEPS